MIRKLVFAVIIVAGTVAFGQPEDGKSYFIKSRHHNLFVYASGDHLLLGTSNEKTLFTVERKGENSYLKSTDGLYLSAFEMGHGNDETRAVGLMPRPQAWEAFAFDKKDAFGSYYIRSLKWNTYLRANISKGIVDQATSPQAWEEFEFVALQRPDSTKGQRDNPINVIHVGLEFPGSSVGGVGSVTGALVRYETDYGHVADGRGHSDQFMQASVVTPWYDIIKPGDKAQRVMQTKHWFKGNIVHSEVYVWNNNGMTQYLVKPDEQFREMFDIGNVRHLYDTLAHSNFIERTAYFASAATSFLSEFKDLKTHRHFDVADIHSMVLGLIPKIFTEVYVPKVKKGNAELPKTVFHLHSTFDVPFGQLSSAQYAYMGLVRPDQTNVVAEAVKGVDAVIAVSKWVKDAAIENETLGPNLAPGKIFNILNGIDFAAWNPATLKGEAGEDLGFGPDNGVEGKKRIKEYLASKGILQDPGRPLIVFVGRFSREKGIEMIPIAATEALALGANVVIMGTYAGDQDPFKIVENLKNSNKDNPHLHVMLTVEEQQKGNLGKLIRAAADFGFVPSFSEGGPLVPREFMSSGALIITSGVEGLAEQVQDFREVASIRESGNGFAYGNNESDRVERMKKAIHDAICFIQTTSNDDRRAVLSRILHQAPSFDWLAGNGAIEQTFKIYKSLLERPN